MNKRHRMIKKVRKKKLRKKKINRLNTNYNIYDFPVVSTLWRYEAVV